MNNKVFSRFQSERIGYHYPNIVKAVRKHGYFSTFVVGKCCNFRICEADLPVIKQQLIDDNIIVNNPDGWLCEVVNNGIK